MLGKVFICCLLFFKLLQSEGPIFYISFTCRISQHCKGTLVYNISKTLYYYFAWCPIITQISFQFSQFLEIKFSQFLEINCTLQNGTMHMLKAN